MKCVASQKLTEAYQALYPAEFNTNNAFEQVEKILTNWLNTYSVEPEKKVSVSNWSGKVTKALFLALELKIPKTKSEMLKVLQ